MKQLIRTYTGKLKKLSSFLAMSDGKCCSVSKEGNRHLRIKLVLLEIKRFWDTLSHFVAEKGLIKSYADKYTDLKNFRKFLSQKLTFTNYFHQTKEYLPEKNKQFLGRGKCGNTTSHKIYF